ncbi:PA14 domain-containing protein [Virgibacillus salexigens]|uniref:PA14 domain protein n=1 Tax=Virgibacillus massiliensis TaxID=1462526 RepID=A0A024QHQ6_9BACI|nr:PA14 domain-containing protein [Virgibacillus massiliensis]CDQ41792.1 PA14 domain protein [Virgibacillus massiliensis]
MEENINPDPINVEETDEIERNDEDYQIDPWTEDNEMAEYIPPRGHLTEIQTEGKEEIEKVNAFHSGIGDNDDLFLKTPESEELTIPFKYAARHRGRKKHQTTIYPEIPFEYGIHYEGEELVTDNEQAYDHRVDAYPGKTMKYSVKQKDPQPTNRDWEAQLNVESRVKQETLEYAVNWRGKAAVEAVSGAADLFTSRNGNFIGPGPRSVWNKSGNYVKEIDNRSHASGIIAKEFYNWTDYEAEYEFKAIKSTGLRSDPYAKVVTSSNRLVSMPGADNDVLGFIFRADRNNKDFYIFLWEGDETCVSSWKPKSYNGYNMLTGNLTGGYSHTKAENKYSRYTVSTNLATIGVGNYYSGMKLSSSQMSKYRNISNNYGWGKQHYKVYKVTNGVMREVKINYRGNGAGWKQDWFNMNWKNSVKVRCTGNQVKIYTQSYKSGRYSENNYRLAAQFNVSSSFSKGSVGLATFSQSVQFEKIAVTRWDDISGRKPESGWYKYKDPGSKKLASSGASYVNSEARAAARAQTGLSNPDYEVNSVTRIVRDSSKGAMSASANGPVTVKTYNPPDAGQIRKHKIIKKGTAFITPEQISPSTANVVFRTADEIFGVDLQRYLDKNPILIYERSNVQINVPSNPLDDWDLEGERFTMWERNPEVIETTKDFTDKVYAYQGWYQSIDCREEFDGLQWATYHLSVVPQTINDDYDEIELKNEKVYMRTTEWYQGTYPADIKNEGIVTNREHKFVDIPPMPEHYIEPNTGEVMYHGYEDVEFLLIQIKPNATNEVWMGFKSNFENENTNITTEPINIINGRPLIKTKQIADQVEIHCEDRPRLVPWISGKYIGYGKVNGRRPFFKDGLGKADMIDVPTDVVYIPDHLVSLTGPYIEVNDERINWNLSEDKKTVDFFSDHMDAYVWYTDWYSEWKECNTEFTISSNETLTIEDPIEIDPKEDPYYDMADTIIDKFEVISTNPFVDVWTEEVRGEGSGWNGYYYQYPLLSHIIAESMQAIGDYQEMIQSYQIKDYMDEVEVDIDHDGFQIISVIRDDIELPNDSENGWTQYNDKIILHGNAIQPGMVHIHYSLGSVEREFVLNKPTGKDIHVYHNGILLNKSQYDIDSNRLRIYSSLNKYDWLHVQSYISEDQFNPDAKNYLGELKGTRIDPEIWFDWGNGSPLHEFMEQQRTSISMMALNPNLHFRFHLDMEVVYPIQEIIDISNFTGEWVQWDEDPIEQEGLNGPGDWHGPPEENYQEVTNLKNQNLRSGWYNPSDLNRTDYRFGFKVQVRDGDDDMYGAIFKFDDTTQNFYSFEWDGGGVDVKGMAVFKNTCLNPEEAGVSKLTYDKVMLAHNNLTWTPDANEINEIEISTKGSQIKVWTNGVLQFDLTDVDNPFLKGAWGPVTRSQPYTYFWDFWLQKYQRITPNEEPSFSQIMSYEIERPVIEDNPNIEVHISDRVQTLLYEPLSIFVEGHNLQVDELEVEYFIRNDSSDYQTYFKNQQETGQTITQIGESEVYATVRGHNPPPPPPENKPIDNKDEPSIEPITLPEANPNNYFAISWDGYLFAPETGFYEFSIQVSDAVRMWVNHQLIIDKWDRNTYNEYTDTFYLEGGKWYPTKLNYADLEDSALIQLSWKTPSGRYEKLSSSNISPYLGYNIKAEIKEEMPMPWSPKIHNGYYYFQEREHYLFAREIELNKVVQEEELLISPRPKQGSPIIIETLDGRLLRKVNFYNEYNHISLKNKEIIKGNGSKNYYLKYQDIDNSTLTVSVNDQAIDDYEWDQEKSCICFKEKMLAKDKIEVSYKIQDSFYVIENQNVSKDQAAVVFHNYQELNEVKIKYEGHEASPFYKTNVMTNPLLNHNHKGFFYLTNKVDRNAKSINLNISPNSLDTSGTEKVLLTVRVYDKNHNPIPNKAFTIFRDGTRIYNGFTNESGEYYYMDIPPVSNELFSTYRVECESIENSILLNFFEDNIKQRAFIELKAGKSTLLGNSEDEVGIYITLRNHEWSVIKNSNVTVSYMDTNQVSHSETITTDQYGQGMIILSGQIEKNGIIYVTATYDMGEEHAKTDLYLKVIGG